MIVTFDGFKEKQKEVEDYRKSILKLIDDFINTDKDIIKNHIIREPYKGSTDFFVNDQRGGRLQITYRWGEPFSKTDDIYLDGLESRKLQEFMKDPELYKNQNKFNI